MAGYTRTVSGLQRKYAQQAFELANLDTEIETAKEAIRKLEELEAQRADLGRSQEALRQSILVFDPAWSGEDKRTNRRWSPLPSGTPIKHALTMLRENPSGYSSAEIMRDLTKTHNLHVHPDMTREMVRVSLMSSLSRYKQKGLVELVGQPRKWRLIPKQASGRRPATASPAGAA